MKKSLLGLAVIVLIFGTSVTNALTISPARVEISADPGTTVSGVLTLMNEEGYEKVYYSSSQNFEAQGESGTPAFTSSNEGLASWINLSPSLSFTKGKGQEMKVPFTITVPKDADPGGYFAAIFFSTIPSVGKGDVSVGAKVGSLVLLHVNGNIKQDASILGFTTSDNSFFYTALPISFSYRFNNNGGDRINPTGSITIRDTVWITTTKLAANPTQGNILPGSVRKFTVTWGDDSTSVPTNFFEAVKYEWDNFALGFYSANLSLTYGADGSARATKWIFVFPWQLVIVMTIISIIILTLLVKGIKRYNLWVIKTAGKRYNH